MGCSSPSGRPGLPEPRGGTNAAAWIDAATAETGLGEGAVVVGASADNVIEVLIARMPQIRVVVLEPDRSHVPLVFGTEAARALRDSGRLRVFTGPEYEGAADAWRLFEGTSTPPLILLNPDIFRQMREQARVAVDAAKMIVRAVAGNTEARNRLGGLYIGQTLLSLPRMAREGDCAALEGLFDGLPAVVAAAGPSLDNAVAELARLRNRCVVIAVDTAARPLLHHGIVPDLIVSIDPTLPNARHLCNLPGGAATSWLVAEPSLHPAALAGFAGRTFFGRVGNFHPWPWLTSRGVDRHKLTVWSSVLTAGLDVALLLGHDPIALVGADLAFSEGRPYCRHTVFEEDWAQETAHGRSLEDLWRTIIERQATTAASSGNQHDAPRSTAGMLSARDWLLARLRAIGDRTIVNCTGAGLLTASSLPQSSLRAVLSAAPRIVADTAACLASAHARAMRPTTATLELARDFIAATPLARGREVVDGWVSFAGTHDARPRAAGQPTRDRHSVPPQVLLSFDRLPRGATVVVVGELAAIVCRVLDRLRPDVRVIQHPPEGQPFEPHRLADRLDASGLPRTFDLVLTASAYNDDLATALCSVEPLFVIPKLALTLLNVLSRPLPWLSHAHRLYPSSQAAMQDPTFRAALDALADEVERVKYCALACDPGLEGCLLDRIGELSGSAALRDRVVEDLLRSAAGPDGGPYVSGLDIARVSVGMEVGIGAGTWMLEVLRRSRSDARHFAFDPNRPALVHGEAYAYLERDGRVSFSARPLWDRCTEGLALPEGGRYEVREYLGSDAGLLRGGRYVKLHTDTIDAFAARHDLAPLDLLLVDAGGSELRVLQGGAVTLARSRPQVAVAAYHSREDHADIPRFLHGLLPGYRFRVANHTGFRPGQKTIVYGVPWDLTGTHGCPPAAQAQGEVQ